jgi:hypothetical protein
MSCITRARQQHIRTMGSVSRFLVFLAVGAFGGGVGACAALSGLDKYSPGVDASIAIGEGGSSHLPDSSGPTRGDTSSQDVVVWGEGDGTLDNDSGDGTLGTGDVTMNDGSDGGTDAGNQSDASDASDAGGSEGGDGGADADGAPPACGSSSCGGCCETNGTCVGGMSNATCGTGGMTCANCGSQSCNNGSCSSVVSDAGRCTPTSCSLFTTLCIPGYESPCCKSDGTCSCRINFPLPPGPCL